MPTTQTTEKAEAHTAGEVRERVHVIGKGIVDWWSKDGAWHIALPCPLLVDGLHTGGFQWTAAQYPSKQAALNALDSKAEKGAQ